MHLSRFRHQCVLNGNNSCVGVPIYQAFIKTIRKMIGEWVKRNKWIGRGRPQLTGASKLVMINVDKKDKYYQFSWSLRNVAELKQLQGNVIKSQLSVLCPLILRPLDDFFLFFFHFPLSLLLDLPFLFNSYFHDVFLFCRFHVFSQFFPYDPLLLVSFASIHFIQ